MEFMIEKAVADDYQNLADIIVAVWNQIEIKDWFVADDPENIQQMLKQGCGIGYKAVNKDTGALAGVFIVAFPQEREDNLGRDIGLPEEELKKVAHMESVAILPKYRGQGLQYTLMQTAEQELRQKGYGYLMCTIHPDNIYSKNNAIRQGYEVVLTKEKYGGFIRNILLKKIN